MNFDPQVRPIAVPNHCRLVNSGQAMENRIRYMAQSVLVSLVQGSYLPTLREARDILAWADIGVRV